MKLWERKLPLIFYKDIMELSLLMVIQEVVKLIPCLVMMTELFPLWLIKYFLKKALMPKLVVQ